MTNPKCPICKTKMKKTEMSGLTEMGIWGAKEGITVKDEFAFKKELMWQCPHCYHTIDLKGRER
jgi:hypothetical protein